MSPTQTLPARETDGAGYELELKLRDFRLIAGMLSADTGIVLEQSKMPLVHARLARRVRDLGLRGFGAYCVLLASEQGAAERVYMREALTTNITRFFREAHHFKHLKSVALPPLIAEARKGARVRLWSAGCSTGEEPYSIALTILSCLSDAPRYDIKILASDIDSNVLGFGRKAVYATGALTGVDEEMRKRWFVSAGSGAGERFQLGPEARALVAFRTHNLVGEWPMRGPFQAIFCRNTVIYFDDASRHAVWTRMASLLAPGGFLYTGHSERLPPDVVGMPACGLTIYQKTNRRSPGKDGSRGVSDA